MKDFKYMRKKNYGNFAIIKTASNEPEWIPHIKIVITFWSRLNSAEGSNQHFISVMFGN